MTTQDLVARHQSDTNALKALFENDKIDRDTLDARIEQIDNTLFEALGIFPTNEVVSVVDRIAAYS